MFDEYYYTKSACILLGYSDQRCDINSADERFWRENEWDTGAWVPPAARQVDDRVRRACVRDRIDGWRAGAAVTGTATVMLLAVIIQLLWASPLWTFIGGPPVSHRGVEPRPIADGTLDIFVAFWVVLVFVFLLLDRRWIERRTPPPAVDASPAGDGEAAARPKRRLPAPLWRPYRFAAGAAGGAAMATKWSGLTAVVTAIALGFIWEVMRRKRFGVSKPIAKTITTEGFGFVLALLVTPCIVYVASYIPWFLHFGWDLQRWAEMQGKAAKFHADLKAVNDQGQPWHAYFAPAWKWIVLARPTYYYGAFASDGVRQVIYAQGNPGDLLGHLLAIPYVVYAGGHKHDWRAGFIVVAIAACTCPGSWSRARSSSSTPCRSRPSSSSRSSTRSATCPRCTSRDSRPAVPAVRGGVRRRVGDPVHLVLAGPDGRAITTPPSNGRYRVHVPRLTNRPEARTSSARAPASSAMARTEDVSGCGTASGWPRRSTCPEDDPTARARCLLEALPYRKDDLTSSYAASTSGCATSRLRRLPARRARHRLVGGRRHRRVPGSRAGRPGRGDRLAGRAADGATATSACSGTSYSGFNSLQIALRAAAGAEGDLRDLRQRRPVDRRRALARRRAAAGRPRRLLPLHDADERAAAGARGVGRRLARGVAAPAARPRAVGADLAAGEPRRPLLAARLGRATATTATTASTAR